MKNHTDGWNEAIAKTNARIGADQDANAPPEPENKNEHPEVIAVRKRCEAIASACIDAGMSDHTISYFADPRSVDEILAEIRATHLATDFASHLGIKSEFRMKVN